jgi:hypothetical protein
LEDKFNEEEIRAFKEAFMFFDREGDGTMAIEGIIYQILLIIRPGLGITCPRIFGDREGGQGVTI